ncbi:MAG: LuxR C-terminal-related transcriptional regulator [Deltaproteobacteria bacterium]|nr:LuxR C-terminal-related transcriptional regulator [Kofleriaceae bacterium]
MATGPGTRQIASFLLDLHRRSHELGYRAMQRAALGELRALIPFDGALFGVGTVQGTQAEAHDVFLFDMPPDLMTSWAEVRDEDRLAFAATSAPGTTIAVSTSDAFYAGCDRALAHCARFDIAHLMCTAHVYAEAGLYWVMSLYRKPASPAFTEEERVTKELLSPHLFAASRHARINELRSFAQVAGGHGQITAIASPAGLVLEAEPGLVDVLRAEWPRWTGPFLPPPLEAALSGGVGRFVGERIVVRADLAEDTRLVQARRRVAADELTDRERQIAEAFAMGESHREIGDRLGIAPATVRRHLANLYEKLGVSSKAELDRMLRGAV